MQPRPSSRVALLMPGLRDLIQQFLIVAPSNEPTQIVVGPEAAAWGAEACALAGHGLDLHRGEHVLAAVRYHIAPRGTQHLATLALTNTRLILGGYASIKHGLNALGISLAYDQIASVTAERSFIKGATLELLTAGGKISLEEVYRHALADFFKALGALPVGTRAEAGGDAIRPSAEDPYGASTARREQWAADPLADGILGRIEQAASHGTLDTNTGLDLVGRCVVAHRARLQAPGCYGDGFASAALAHELPAVLAPLLGNPIAQQQGQDGTLYVDYSVPRTEGTPPALAALGVASFVGLGVGFSPGRMLAQEMMRKRPLQSIRLVARDASGGTYYALFDGGSAQPLHQSEALWAHGIHQMIAHHGPQLLAMRVDGMLDGPGHAQADSNARTGFTG